MTNIDPNAEANQPDDAEEDVDALWAEFDEAEGLTAATPEEEAAADGFTMPEEEGEPQAAEPAEGEPTAGAEPQEGEPADDTTAPDTAAEPAIDERWANAPEDLRAELVRLSTENAKLAQKERSANGRYTAAQRRYDDLVKAAQPREAKGDRPSPAAALATLKDDYPEIAGPLEKALGSIEGQMQELSEAEEGRRKAAETELADYLDAEAKILTSQHPDYLDVLGKNGDRFVAWIDDQPRAVRDAFSRNSEQITNAAEAATVIAAFKSHIGIATAAPAAERTAATPPLDARRARQLEATKTPARASRRPATSGIPEEGDPQAIWDAFDALETAG